MSLDKINDKIIKALERKVKLLEEQIDCLRFLLINKDDQISALQLKDELKVQSDEILKKLKKPNLLDGRTKEWDVYDDY